jgi:hypothetical protein
VPILFQIGAKTDMHTGNLIMSKKFANLFIDAKIPTKQQLTEPENMILILIGANCWK